MNTNLQFKKKVDKSTISTGITLPLDCHQTIYDIVGFVHKGQPRPIRLMIDDEYYDARFSHVDYTDNPNRETLQILWSDKRTKDKMKEIFRSSYNYFENGGKTDMAPENYYELLSTEDSLVFRVNYYIANSNNALDYDPIVKPPAIRSKRQISRTLSEERKFCQSLKSLMENDILTSEALHHLQQAYDIMDGIAIEKASIERRNQEEIAKQNRIAELKAELARLEGEKINLDGNDISGLIDDMF